MIQKLSTSACSPEALQTRDGGAGGGEGLGDRSVKKGCLTTPNLAHHSSLPEIRRRRVFRAFSVPGAE